MAMFLPGIFVVGHNLKPLSTRDNRTWQNLKTLLLICQPLNTILCPIAYFCGFGKLLLKVHYNLIYKNCGATKFEPLKPQGISYMERERGEGGGEGERGRERGVGGQAGQQGGIYNVRSGLEEIQRFRQTERHR